MNDPIGVDWLIEVLFYEIMEGWPVARQRLNSRLTQLYAGCNPSQQYALDIVFCELCHKSFSECFNISAYAESLRSMKVS